MHNWNWKRIRRCWLLFVGVVLAISIAANFEECLIPLLAVAFLATGAFTFGAVVIEVADLVNNWKSRRADGQQLEIKACGFRHQLGADQKAVV